MSPARCVVAWRVSFARREDGEQLGSYIVPAANKRAATVKAWRAHRACPADGQLPHARVLVEAQKIREEAAEKEKE